MQNILWNLRLVIQFSPVKLKTLEIGRGNQSYSKKQALKTILYIVFMN